LSLHVELSLETWCVYGVWRRQLTPARRRAISSLYVNRRRLGCQSLGGVDVARRELSEVGGVTRHDGTSCRERIQVDSTARHVDCLMTARAAYATHMLSLPPPTRLCFRRCLSVCLFVC